MNKRHGMEAIYGIGGGIVSSTSRKNLEKAEDLCRKRKPTQAVPYLIAAIEEDPNNLDAAIQIAFLGQDYRHAVEVLESAEITGRVVMKEHLGDDCFDDSGDCVGHFWRIMETRPYMRVLQALVRVYFEADRPKDSEKTIIEMLRLCPGDNMGQRHWLGSLLIRNGRFSEALYFAQAWLIDSEDGEIPRLGGTAFATPSKDLLSDEMEADLTKFSHGSLMHTAALASFKLFGDCEKSRQFLRMAVHVQPHVLLKVLALVSRPPNLNMNPRSMNGPEEAQDYLWLTQDLWMEPAVWKWANENPDVLKVILKDCSGSGCSTHEDKVAQFKRCAACHLVRYCSPECQKTDWPTHKPVCKAHKAIKDSMKAFR